MLFGLLNVVKEVGWAGTGHEDSRWGDEAKAAGGKENFAGDFLRTSTILCCPFFFLTTLDRIRRIWIK